MSLNHCSGLVVVGGHVRVGGGACEVSDARGEAVWDQEGGGCAGVEVGEVRAPAIAEELLVVIKDTVYDHTGVNNVWPGLLYTRVARLL